MLENLKAFGFSETFELCENKNGWSDQKDIKRISGNLKWLQGNNMQYLLRIKFYIFAPDPLLLVTFPQVKNLLPLSGKEVHARTHLV